MYAVTHLHNHDNSISIDLVILRLLGAKLIICEFVVFLVMLLAWPCYVIKCNIHLRGHSFMMSTRKSGF